MKKHPILFFFALIGFLCFISVVVGVIFIFSLVGEKPSILRSDSIGVLKIEGVIFESESYLKTIEKYKEQDHIKAVLVRINSPGGAVGPSQEIYEALKDLRQTKKVVASMGSVAASGGYYIACASDKIVSNAGTLTGSIGVIMEFAHLQGLFKWAKMDHTVIKSGRYKDTGSPLRPMTEEEKKLLNDLVQSVYHQFREVVISERKLRLDEIEMLTDGRVFTGLQAKEHNLVDKIGNFQVAVKLTQELAGIKDKPHLVYPEKEKKLMKLIFGESSSKIMEQAVKRHSLNSPLLYLMPF